MNTTENKLTGTGVAAGDTTTVTQPAPAASTDTSKLARPGSKRGIAVQIMKDNAEKPMHEVLKLIAEANAYSLGDARSYYVWIVKNGYAPGVIEERQKKAKTEKVGGKKQVTLSEISAGLSPEEIEAKRVETAKKIADVQEKLRNRGKGNKSGAETTETKVEEAQVSL